MGDDAGFMLVTDTQLNVLDSIWIYPEAKERLSKETKPDLEGLTVVRSAHRNRLLAVGSGSFQSYRNLAWLIDPFRKTADSIRLDSFYQRLKNAGIKDLNIEGICSVYGSMVFASRGNKSFPKNFLVITNPEFWTNQSTVNFSMIRAGYNTDPAVFSGISGLAYSGKTDNIIMSISTENTSNSYDDGTIGKSYLWIFKNMSGKREWSAINPDIIIDLEEVDPRFKGQKIESLCITSETKKEMKIVLVADNDDGSSTLFKMNVIKK